MIIRTGNRGVTSYKESHVTRKEYLPGKKSAIRKKHGSTCKRRIVNSLLNCRGRKRFPVGRRVIRCFCNIENRRIRQYVAAKIRVVIYSYTHKSKSGFACGKYRVRYFLHGIYEFKSARTVSAVDHKVICAVLRIGYDFYIHRILAGIVHKVTVSAEYSYVFIPV